jgi:hypothetical protein
MIMTSLVSTHTTYWTLRVELILFGTKYNGWDMRVFGPHLRTTDI